MGDVFVPAQKSQHWVAVKVLKDQGRLQTPTKVKRRQLAIHRLRSRKSHCGIDDGIYERDAKAHERLQG